MISKERLDQIREWDGKDPQVSDMLRHIEALTRSQDALIDRARVHGFRDGWNAAMVNDTKQLDDALASYPPHPGRTLPDAPSGTGDLIDRLSKQESARADARARALDEAVRALCRVENGGRIRFGDGSWSPGCDCNNHRPIEGASR